MKNHNKANGCRTQIADISMAGKELSEENLRIVGGGLAIGGIIAGSCKVTNYVEMTCTAADRQGWCTGWKTDWTIPMLDCDSSGVIAK